MLPSFRQKRALPWVAVAVSLVLALVGLLTNDRTLVLLGCAGAVAVVVGYPLAHLLIGPEPHADDPASDDPPAHP